MKSALERSYGWHDRFLVYKIRVEVRSLVTILAHDLIIGLMRFWFSGK